MSKHVPLSCRLNLRHRWRRAYTEDGGRYLACTQCGKEHAPTSFGNNTIGA